jgi:hypothetical protein
MDTFNNNTRLFSNEKSVLDVLKDVIAKSLEINKPISISIISDFYFFDGLKKNLPELIKLNENKLLVNLNILLGSQNDITTKDYLKDLRNAATAINSDLYSFLEKLEQNQSFNVRILLDKRINLKLFLFNIEEDIEVWTGAASIISGCQNDNIELLFPVGDDQGNVKYLDFFKDLWDISSEKISIYKITDILKESSKESSFYLNQKDFVSFMIKTLRKDYLVRNIGSDLSTISEFQHMSYYLCLEKLKNFGCAFIFNTAGIGKTDISAMVSKYYRENDGKILIIHSPNGLNRWKQSIKKCGLDEKDVNFISRSDLYKDKIKLETYFGLDLLIIEDALLYKNTKNKTNFNTNFENIIKMNSNCACIFITDKPFGFSLLDFTETLKYAIKGSYIQQYKSNEIIKKIVVLEKKIAENNTTPEFFELLNNLIETFSVNLNLKELNLYYPDLNYKSVERSIMTQVKYAYDHEIYAKLYDKLVFNLGELNFEYIKLWSKKINEQKMFYYKWKLCKYLESSMYSFRVSLKKVLDKNILAKKVLVDKVSDFTENCFSTEQIENIKTNFADMGGSEQDKSLSNITNDIKTIETIISNIEQIRYLENRDDKITNLLKILKNENKPTIVYTEMKDTALYIERRLKDYGSFKLGIVYSSETGLEGFDEEEEIDIDHEKIRKSFETGEIDVLITTDVLDENIYFQRAEILINFDFPNNLSTINSRLNKITRSQTPKKIKVFTFQPERRVDKETEMFEKQHFPLENIFSLMGRDFYPWIIKNRNINTFSTGDMFDLLSSINQYKDALASKNPEENQDNLFSKNLNNDIVLREFIKNYNVSEDTIKLTSDSYKKPVYTLLKSDKEGFYVFFNYHGNFYDLGNIYFSDAGQQKELSLKEYEDITTSIKNKILEINKESGNDELIFEEVKIGIIKYYKDEN